MKKLFLTLGLAAITAIGWGQEILYHNGCEELPVFTGEPSENDSLEIELYTDYDMSDWGHWSPRWKFTRYAYYTGYGTTNIPTSYLYSSIGIFDVSQLDSISLILNGKHNGWNYSSNSFKIKATVDNGFEFTFISIPINLGWGEYSTTLFLGDIDISTIELFIEFTLGGYPSSSEYDYYRGYSDFTIDDISVIGYTSELIIEEPLICDTVYIEQPPTIIYETDLPQECLLDYDNNGMIGGPDLLNLLQWYGNESPCFQYSSDSPNGMSLGFNNIPYYNGADNKNILRIINPVTGQEVLPNTKGLLLYIYEDGTVEKRMNLLN